MCEVSALLPQLSNRKYTYEAQETRPYQGHLLGRHLGILCIQRSFSFQGILLEAPLPILYLAEVLRDDFGQTSESLEVRLFEEDEIPWEELAFPFVPLVLKHYLNDRKSNNFKLKIETIVKTTKKASQ